MSSRIIPKKGEKYNHLTFTGKWEVINKRDGGKFISAEMVCNCLLKTKLWGSATRVRNGRIKSCGCEKIKATKLSNTKHGLRNHPLYDIWRGIKKRTLNISNHNYHLYGERGIKICDDWVNDFKSFHDWSIKNGWRKGLSIDRVDNNGYYHPDNCRWATQKEQCRNKRNNIVYKGVYAEDRSFELGGQRTMVAERIRQGWSYKDAFEMPKHTQIRKNK